MTPGGIDPDFDVSEFCKNLRNSKQPPYVCPVADCLKKYRTICGLQYHLKNHDHITPAATPTASPARKHKKKGRNSQKTPAKTQDLLQPVVRETLTYAEAQKVVEFEVESRVFRVDINDPILIMAKEDYEEKYGASDAKEGKPIQRLDPMKPDELKVKLPEPSFTILENYNISDAPPRPTNAYIRFIERSADELDCEVEYDLDEEDCAWLAIMNEARAETGLPAVSVDTFELLMDRLEKESYFQMANMKPSDVGPSDDDAVCCICMDGECQNSNVILFCDMCNLAVHQDCYGVPYIPEGQWHCRRCIQSPSQPVDCALCPNTGGAFKQTDRGNWAHVVCALWIPEVRFANTVFLEPIDSIETIPNARWRLTCYICKQKGVGACIQCHKTNCYAAFHVTCAQSAGLYMKMDTVKDNLSAASGELAPVMVQKTAFCDAHTPGDAETRPRMPVTLPSKVGKASKDSKLNMKKARRILAKNRTSVPLISIPTIPTERIQEIGSLVTMPKKSYFLQRLVAYWTLKRQFRNGVPLLRRLQTTHFTRRDDGKLSTELDEIYRQMKYLKCLRQDLEKARLLCELVRKREKKKNELTRAKEACMLVELCPLQYFLTRIWEQISARDTNAIFMEPVDTNEVPDYSEVNIPTVCISLHRLSFGFSTVLPAVFKESKAEERRETYAIVTHPMDLSTMKAKIDEMKYLSIAEFEGDFKLMINNCLTYNSKDTIFYRAGLRMKDQGLAIIHSAQMEAQEIGIEGAAAKRIRQLSTPKPEVATEAESAPGRIEEELASLRSCSASMSLDDQMKKLITLADLAQSVKDPVARNKQCRLIKTEMTKLKKIISSAAKVVPLIKTPVKVSEEKGFESSSPAKKKTPIRKVMSSSSSDSDDSSSSEDKPLKPPRQKTPPKNEQKRRRSCTKPSEVKRIVKEEPIKKESSGESREENRTPSKLSTGSDRSDSTTASPSGVNRRTAVLFTRKAQAQAAFKKPATTALSDNVVSTPPPASVPPPAKRRAGRPRRNLDASLSGKRASNSSTVGTPDENIPIPTSDSFRIYRSGGEIPQETDEESPSETSCTSCSGSGSSCSSSGSDSSSDGETNDNGASSSEEGSERKTSRVDEPILEPLTLVWAKCRGYPWYPALIINPKMPRDYIHNGVPIPAPPSDVLALANSYTEPVYLVLFFDTKRTWQWLPRNKLELLGISEELDEAKQTESRKPTDRKAVRKAYRDALHHRRQVTKVAENLKQEKEK